MQALLGFHVDLWDYMTFVAATAGPLTLVNADIFSGAWNG